MPLFVLLKPYTQEYNIPHNHGTPGPLAGLLLRSALLWGCDYCDMDSDFVYPFLNIASLANIVVCFPFTKYRKHRKNRSKKADAETGQTGTEDGQRIQELEQSLARGAAEGSHQQPSSGRGK